MCTAPQAILAVEHGRARFDTVAHVHTDKNASEQMSYRLDARTCPHTVGQINKGIQQMSLTDVRPL